MFIQIIYSSRQSSSKRFVADDGARLDLAFACLDFAIGILCRGCAHSSTPHSMREPLYFLLLLRQLQQYILQKKNKLTLAERRKSTYSRLIMHVRANIAALTELVLIKQWPPMNSTLMTVKLCICSRSSTMSCSL